MTDMDGACVAQIRIISQSRLHPRESPGMPVIIFLSGSASSLFTGPWNALTLLHMQPIADTDKDGLPSQTGLKNGKKSKEKNQQPPQLSLSVSLSLSPPLSLSLSISLSLSPPLSLSLYISLSLPPISLSLCVSLSLSPPLSLSLSISLSLPPISSVHE